MTDSSKTRELILRPKRCGNGKLIRAAKPCGLPLRSEQREEVVDASENREIEEGEINELENVTTEKNADYVQSTEDKAARKAARMAAKEQRKAEKAAKKEGKAARRAARAVKKAAASDLTQMPRGMFNHRRARQLAHCSRSPISMRPVGPRTL